MKDQPQSTLIRQLLARVRRLEIRTRRMVDRLAAGAYHSVFKGRGIEFEEVREYQGDDDARDIDWNVTARLARPFVKKFVEERELTVMLLVDISSSLCFGRRGSDKMEKAAELAALLAFSAVRNQDRVGLLLFSAEPEVYVVPRKGRRHALRIVRELLATRGAEKRQTDIAKALRRTMRLLPQRSVLFLISDLLDRDYGQALAAVGARHDLTAIRISDPREQPAKPVGYLAAEDAETGEFTWFPGRGSKDMQRFSAVVGELRASASAECRQAGVELIEVAVGGDPVKPLMRFFRERERRQSR